MGQQYSEQIPNPMVESTLRAWRENGGKYRLEGTICTKCQTKFFPRRSVCANCNSLDVEKFRFKHEGIIENVISSGIPKLAIIGYGEHSPRYIATIRLTEGPVIVGEIVDVCDPSKLMHGLKVRMVIRKQARSTNSNWKYGYKFKIV